MKELSKISSQNYEFGKKRQDLKKALVIKVEELELRVQEAQRRGSNL